MDIVTHAVVGAATGAAFGRPFAGMAFAVLPDLFLFSVKRRDTPTAAYNASHSFAGLVLVTILAGLYAPSLGGVAFFAYASHIVLDVPTHGERWAPPLMWPSKRRYSMGDEWEWFNYSWFHGAFLAILWIIVCLPLSLSHIGSR
jgi:membrane-bound metal-dependent hydrolase YbcI (DUF457 family)